MEALLGKLIDAALVDVCDRNVRAGSAV